MSSPVDAVRLASEAEQARLDKVAHGTAQSHGEAVELMLERVVIPLYEAQHRAMVFAVMVRGPHEFGTWAGWERSDRVYRAAREMLGCALSGAYRDGPRVGAHIVPDFGGADALVRHRVGPLCSGHEYARGKYTHRVDCDVHGQADPEE